MITPLRPIENLSKEEVILTLFRSLLPENLIQEYLAKPSFDPNSNEAVAVPDFIPVEIKNPRIKDRYETGSSNYGTTPPDGPLVISNDLFENQEIEYLILSTYVPIEGLIPASFKFHLENLRKYAGHLIRKVVATGHHYNTELVFLTCVYLVELVISHESFHYYCDYKRRITGSVFDRCHEEALAVAHSHANLSFHGLNRNKFFHPMYHHRHDDQPLLRITNIVQKMKWSSEESQQHFILFLEDLILNIVRENVQEIKRSLMTESFSDYRGLPGYQDWQRYNRHQCYENEFYDYIKNEVLDALRNAAVPVNEIRSELNFIGSRGVLFCYA